jgi:hypothetical protein
LEQTETLDNGEDALQALEMIKAGEEIILGGDILSQENNELI